MSPWELAKLLSGFAIEDVRPGQVYSEQVRERRRDAMFLGFLLMDRDHLKNLAREYCSACGEDAYRKWWLEI